MKGLSEEQGTHLGGGWRRQNEGKAEEEKKVTQRDTVSPLLVPVHSLPPHTHAPHIRCVATVGGSRVESGPKQVGGGVNAAEVESESSG